MLADVNTIYTPTTVEEATHLVTESGVRPLYGGVALHRESPRGITGVVDLSRLGLDQHRVFETGFSLGSMMTLEAARQVCLSLSETIPNARFLAVMLELEAPITLRNTITLGDVLVERQSNSILLTALTAFDAQIEANGWQRFIHEWLESPNEEVLHAIITAIALEKGQPNGRYAFEKVARTPADMPMVGVIGYAVRRADGQLQDIRLGACGVASSPIPLAQVDESLLATNGDIEAALATLSLHPPSDHWGSSAYRLEMVQVLTRRVLTQILSE